MNAVSRVSSLSLALPVSNIPVSSSLSFVPLSCFLRPRFPSVSPFLFGPSLSLLSCSALDSRNPFISRSRFRGSVPFFSPFPTYMFAFPPPPFSPPLLPTSSLFRRPLRARFSGFSCAPFQPPAYPLRNRSTETCSGVAGTNENATEGNGVAYEIRGDLKERRKKRIYNARCIATPLSSSVFYRFPFWHHVAVLASPMHISSRPWKQIRKWELLTQTSIRDYWHFACLRLHSILDDLISFALFYSLEFVLLYLFLLYSRLLFTILYYLWNFFL